jgi:hypothetical protein
MAILAGLAGVGAAAFYGGWEWALMGAVVLAILWRVDFALGSVVTALAVSLAWLAVFHWTGDRRMFFPYSMQFALQMPYVLRGKIARPAIVGGGGLILFFLLIRVVQDATMQVLLVETVVALAILGIVVRLCGPSQAMPVRLLAGALASALAFAGLAI